MLRVLDEISSVDPESEEAREFIEVIREIKLFSNKADSTLDTLVKSDSNWFVGTFMKMIKWAFSEYLSRNGKNIRAPDRFARLNSNRRLGLSGKPQGQR